LGQIASLATATQMANNVHITPVMCKRIVPRLIRLWSLVRVTFKGWHPQLRPTLMVAGASQFLMQAL